MTLLVLDAVVFFLALATALETDGPTWMRIVGGVIAVAAVALGVRSALFVYTNRPSTR
ncbi:hypothetical protein BKA08_003781 [Nocardioides marinisabuli]|uniref:Uncharacterized protein n=1 Tax=Nocardioides marinisabuli TaxID=419476 RepID=A0A7Y9JTH1_9ACTN|nr:hypothetical protein [Nocardioides marinisabuli]NYD59543.1 hypothetical protein [Nocardioides marinisabuli]